MMDGVEVGRVNVAARACGVAIRAFELAIALRPAARDVRQADRRAPGGAFRLAEMATKVEAAHQMMVKAARMKDSGERNDLEAGMAKYLASEYCAEVVEDSFRIHGGYGYSKEYEIERLYREAPMLLIGEGTADIQTDDHRPPPARGIPDMTVPDFVARPQLSQDVARYVRRRIFEGAYGAGEYVRLEQLAAELGVSVTPVREALLELRAEGLLVQQPHRGFMVLPVTGRDIADVSSVQAHVGGELAARAAANITGEQLRHLKDIQEQLEEAYRQRDHELAVRLNHDFHRAINVAADSPKLAQLMGQITRYAPESVFPTVEGWPHQSVKDHRRVIAALEKRDEERARTAVAEHFVAGVGPLVEHLTEHGVVNHAERSS